MQSLVASLPVVKRALSALATTAQDFEAGLHEGRHSQTNLGSMLESLAEQVAAAQDLVERVQRLHATFSDKVSQPFTRLQRDALETAGLVV